MILAVLDRRADVPAAPGRRLRLHGRRRPPHRAGGRPRGGPGDGQLASPTGRCPGAPSRSARSGWPARSARSPASPAGWPRPPGSASPRPLVPPASLGGGPGPRRHAGRRGAATSGHAVRADDPPGLSRRRERSTQRSAPSARPTPQRLRLRRRPAGAARCVRPTRPFREESTIPVDRSDDELLRADPGRGRARHRPARRPGADPARPHRRADRARPRQRVGARCAPAASRWTSSSPPPGCASWPRWTARSSSTATAPGSCAPPPS